MKLVATIIAIIAVVLISSGCGGEDRVAVVQDHPPVGHLDRTSDREFIAPACRAAWDKLDEKPKQYHYYVDFKTGKCTLFIQRTTTETIRVTG